MKSIPKWALIVAPIAVVVIVVIGFFFALSGNQSHATKLENQLSVQYQSNQNELSSYVSEVKEQLGVAKTNSAAVDQLISDAMKGRFDNADGSGINSGQLFTVLANTEAYPDLTQTSAPYQQILKTISSGREAYKNKQDLLLDALGQYDTWRKSGFIHKQMVKMAGVPTDSLVARIGTDKWTGQDALDKMYQIVLTKDAVDAYETGQMDPIDTDLTDN